MLTIICPITSRNCGPRVEDQPLFHALLPSMDALEMWDGVRLILGYDSDDRVWSRHAARRSVTQPVRWCRLPPSGQTLTAIWNSLVYQATRFDYLLPANDDMAFQASPFPACHALEARGGFGIIGFDDEAFPGLATFYVVGRMHIDIFGTLYPLSWHGAHQDSWIADVYRPWQASEIDATVKVHNRIKIGAPRFEYGDAPGYRDAVREGRARVNQWLYNHAIGIEPKTELELNECPTLL